MSKKIDEIHSMIKHLVKGKKYDSYGSPINKQKRYVSQPHPSGSTNSSNKNISADIRHILYQLKAREPRIKSTVEQLEDDLTKSSLQNHEVTENSVLKKIDNILLFIDEKRKKDIIRNINK